MSFDDVVHFFNCYYDLFICLFRYSEVATFVVLSMLLRVCVVFQMQMVSRCAAYACVAGVAVNMLKCIYIWLLRLFMYKYHCKYSNDKLICTVYNLTGCVSSNCTGIIIIIEGMHWLYLRDMILYTLVDDLQALLYIHGVRP